MKEMLKKVLIATFSLGVILNLSLLFMIPKAHAETGDEGVGVLEEETTTENSSLSLSSNPQDLPASTNQTATFDDGLSLASSEISSPTHLLPKIVDRPEVKKNNQVNFQNSDLSEVVINEFMANPYGVEPANEWIELYNNGTYPEDISGCLLDDIAGGGSNPYQLPAGTIIAAKGFLVFYGATTNISLNNGGDTVRLYRLVDSTQEPIDSFSYTSTIEGSSFGRIPNGTGVFTNLKYPSPGTVNDNTPPIGGVVNDGILNDIDWSNDAESLSANWSGFSDPESGVASYEYRILGPNDLLISDWTNVGLDTSVTLNNLSLLDGTYYFEVRATNNLGMVSDAKKSDGLTLDTQAPVIDHIELNPSNVTLGPGANLTITIYEKYQEVGLMASGSFNGATLNFAGNNDGSYSATYTVSKTDPTADSVEILNAELTDLTGNIGKGASSGNNINIDTTPPEGPSHISVMPGDGYVIVSWTRVGDAAYYNIYRSSSPYQLIAKVDSTVTSFKDGTVENNKKYLYKVTAIDGVGNETPIDQVLASAEVMPSAIAGPIGGMISKVGATTHREIAYIPSAQAAPESTKITNEAVKGEQNQNNETQKQGQNESKNEQEGKNWPMIAAIIIAVAIILAGLGYWWFVTRESDDSYNKIIADIEAEKKRKGVSRRKR